MIRSKKLIKTVKELKQALENIDGDLPVEVYTGSTLLVDFVQVVQCDDLNCYECGGEGTCQPPAFVIFAETYKED